MPRVELEYPKEAVNSVKRSSDRGVYALRTIHQIINSSRLVHVSFNVPDSPFPVTLPMIGQMGSFARPSADEGDVLDLYLHGYVSARMTNLSRKGTSDGQEDGAGGIPVCISASHVDGLVLALSPFASSYNYRSAVLFGYAVLVSDEEERLYAMELITDSVVPGRWRDARGPPTPAELQSTSILRVRVKSGSAKVRVGEPHDEARDTADAELCARVWSGVVPVHETFGEPIPGPSNSRAVPTYIRDYVKDTNEVSAETAVQAAVEPLKKEKAKESDD
ncbi:hypothetical protein GGTG_00045 [Gaeumannomyces tritici R3-111a-1]|uniref:Flavin-nucleotide-binding protein n=1 Tax=Gaeumannomyces tritici (strain R3-111a-1) TaxID=644352 RepID=J3NFJ9_GAET3|nr:hypothetical protein GGTG_00045 [Gaeumannomyces tritici R3-111a-1]EJT80039.1 hypothetical protein GGTG_00045 [Gaeumannomyces tritici R3-111a-1]